MLRNAMLNNPAYDGTLPPVTQWIAAVQATGNHEQLHWLITLSQIAKTLKAVAEGLHLLCF